MAGVLVVKVLDQLGNHLGVGVRLELVTFALQEKLDVLVVCDDTVVNDDELVFVVRPLRVRVDLRGDSVGSPTRVADSDVDIMDVLKG